MSVARPNSAALSKRSDYRYITNTNYVDRHSSHGLSLKRSETVLSIIIAYFSATHRPINKLILKSFKSCCSCLVSVPFYRCGQSEIKFCFAFVSVLFQLCESSVKSTHERRLPGLGWLSLLNKKGRWGR